MIITMPALSDTIVALLTVVGIAVILSAAFIAAGALFERSRKQHHPVTPALHGPAQHPTQTDDARELVLR